MQIIPAKNPNRRRFGFIDLIHWFDSSSRFIDSIPWFDSWFDSLIRFLVELDVVFLLGELDVVFLLGEIGSFSSKSEKTITFFIKSELDVVFVSNNFLRKSVSNEIGSTKTVKNFRTREKQDLIFKNSSLKRPFFRPGPFREGSVYKAKVCQTKSARQKPWKNFARHKNKI